MKYVVAAVFAAVVALIVVQMGRKAERERLREEEAAAAKVMKAQEARTKAVQEDLERRRAEERQAKLAANAPEKERLQREHPEAWAQLVQRVGGDLGDCLVTAAVTQFDPTKPSVSLLAQCGEHLTELR